MAIKEIREFGDFSGANNEGYIIIGGKTASVEGGKKLLSDVIPSVPQADEETITNNNGELKVTNPIPDPTNHYDAILCVEEHDNNLIWSDDRDEPFDAYDVRMAIGTSRKYIDEDSHDYPLYLNSSGGLSMTSSENEGDVLTTTVNGIEWTPPPAQLQADWEQEDDTQKDYIKNKPTVENGAQVNKIEGIVIQKPHATGDVLPINDKLVTLNFGSGALVDDAGNLDFYCTAPLCNGEASDGGAMLAYDNTLTLKNDALSVADPLPSKSNEKYRKILVLDKYKDAVWTDNIPFGSGSEEGGNNYITPKIPVAVPKDFYYSEDDRHGYPSDYEIEWRDATPPAPYPRFDEDDAPIGTKKSFNLISTVQNINEEFWNTREYDYDWEETQTIPDPKTGSHNGHILTYNSSEGIVWAAQSPLNSLYNLGDISIDTGLNGISDKFGSGRDKPLLVPTIEATEINEDDTSSYPVKKIAMNSETVFDLVNENLQVKWPDPTFPAQSHIGDTIEYKLVAELTGFAPNGRQQISLYWTKAT